MAKKGENITAPVEPVPTFQCAECGNEIELSQLWAAPHRIVGCQETSQYICKTCIRTIYKKLLDAAEDDVFEALFSLCYLYNWVYLEGVITSLLEDPGCKMPDDYLSVILNENNEHYKDKTFFGQFDRHLIGSKSDLTVLEECLSEEDKRNLSEIKKVFLCDPFEDKPMDRRAALYRSLSLMIDASMANDLVRQKAAITIVESFDQLEMIDKTISGLMTDTASITERADEIQTLNKMRTEQQRMITNFCKDHGFSEKYANSKSKGTGTLSAIIRDMEESNYDDGKVNLYDIETSASMAQCAEISAKAICKQLALSDYEFGQMVEEQTHVVRKEIAARKAAEEKARLALSKLHKQELLRELQRECEKKGLGTAEIEERLAAEIAKEAGGAQSTTLS